MSIWVDGLVLGGNQVPRSRQVAPFETMAAVHGDMPLWSVHLQRLQATCERFGVPFSPTPELRAGAAELLRINNHTDDVLRLSIVPDGANAQVVLATRKRSPVKVVKLLPTVVEREPDAPPADIKAEPRRFYDRVRQQAQDGEADDGIVVANDGALLEAALGNLWFLLDDVWVTPPLDGRVLPGIARALLLEQASAASLPVEQRVCTFADLHRAQAIAHSNAVCGPRPACLVGEQVDVELVDRQLGALWRRVLDQGNRAN